MTFDSPVHRVILDQGLLLSILCQSWNLRFNIHCSNQWMLTVRSYNLVLFVPSNHAFYICCLEKAEIAMWQLSCSFAGWNG